MLSIKFSDSDPINFAQIFECEEVVINPTGIFNAPLFIVRLRQPERERER